MTKRFLVVLYDIDLPDEEEREQESALHDSCGICFFRARIREKLDAERLAARKKFEAFRGMWTSI